MLLWQRVLSKDVRSSPQELIRSVTLQLSHLEGEPSSCPLESGLGLWCHRWSRAEVALRGFQGDQNRPPNQTASAWFSLKPCRTMWTSGHRRLSDSCRSEKGGDAETREEQPGNNNAALGDSPGCPLKGDTQQSLWALLQDKTPNEKTPETRVKTPETRLCTQRDLISKPTLEPLP